MNPEYAVGAPMPASVGLCADLYAEIRALRLAMEKEVEDVKRRETEIREHIVDNLSKSLDSGAAGRKYRAQIVVKEKPKIDDWGKVWDFIFEKDRPDLVQRRLNDKAVADMWAEGEEVPGVSKFKAIDVSITKLK